MWKGLQLLRNGMCLVVWMALITLSAVANDLSGTCAISWHIQIERPETNYRLWLPDKAPIPTHFPCQTERGVRMLELVKLKTYSPPLPPLNSNCLANCFLPMWERHTEAQHAWGRLKLKRQEPYGWGCFIYKLVDGGHGGSTVGNGL